MAAAMLGASAVLLLHALLPYTEPWNWLLLGFGIALTITSIALLTRFVLRQRDDYWRERTGSHRE